jgi:hypothetical protein
VTEGTLQQRDPLGASGATQVFAVGTAVVTLSLAVGITALTAGQVGRWPVEVAALLVLAGAAALHVRLTSPFLAPFGRAAFAVVLTLVVLAFVLDEAAQLGRNEIVHDDWGPVVIGLYLAVLAGVRPARDLLVGGLAATGVAAAVTVAASPFVLVSTNGTARALVVLAMIAPAAIGGTVFAHTAVRLLPAGGRPGVAVAEDAVRRSVQQDQVRALEADVVPFLRRLLAEDAVAPADAEHARRVGAGIRAALLTDLRRGWLGELGLAVDDPRGYADRMRPEQRTAVAGLLAALPLADAAAAGSATLRGQDYEGALTLRADLAGRPDRALLAPRVLLLRTVFSSVRYEVEGSTVVVRCTFACPRR